jgi:hypothetical protein
LLLARLDARVALQVLENRERAAAAAAAGGGEPPPLSPGEAAVAAGRARAVMEAAMQPIMRAELAEDGTVRPRPRDRPPLACRGAWARPTLGHA